MPSLRVLSVAVVLLALPAVPAPAQVHLVPGRGLPKPPAEAPAVELDTGILGTLRFRSIGPALTSGRIADLAVDPRNPRRYLVAAASGGVWLTENAGTTFTPVFDGEGSYSIGCVAFDPSNPSIAWVGTGENNSQRSVSFGDGVYRSVDGGRSWTNMGLRDSEHIGMIAVHPHDSDVVFVAAQGPLWRDGGERGLYRTRDGGASWERILHVSDATGISEIHLDPRDPDVMYAVAYQRRRHVWTLVNGGPESGLWKSEDGGESWREIRRGLPGGDKGRIGMAIAPADPDVLYAIVEAANDAGGVFRSTNRGETWEKRSSYMTSSPQYYNEVFCDPSDANRAYFVDTVLQVTDDGGRTVRSVPIRDKHVDDHVVWIDPRDPDHLLVGSDGGLYETFDRGGAWRHFPNLPLTQFYRVAVDTSEPFYFVYGGTQDNFTLGGPSRTRSPAGIASEEWFVVVGGDGFEPAVDPTDPDIVYGQSQHGGLVRYDRRTGENVDIQPQEAPGDEPHRWNWDSPLLISPHDPQRLWFGAQRLFRSDDRGDSWTAVSGDLTRRLDRDTLPVFGRIQKADAVSKHRSTSVYGNLVALDESPLVAGLLYAGSDDGLVSVSEDGGGAWRSIGDFPAVPDVTYVSCLHASRHDPDAVYAAFDNRKMGDFAPYLLKSADRGRTWRSIRGDLPDRHVVYGVVEDPEVAGLLFAGTEFGVFVSIDDGAHWHQLRSGLPTIAVRDLAIQARECDLVLATFGRGFYVLDDYSPLRTLARGRAEGDGTILPVRRALRYVPAGRLGGGRGAQGATYFTAPNPDYGAVFTLRIADVPKTLLEKRRDAERKADGSGEDPPLPTPEAFVAESTERPAAFLLTVRDDADAVVARIPIDRRAGWQRVDWNLRYPSTNPLGEAERELPSWGRMSRGPLALPGTYTATLSRLEGGTETVLAGPEPFEVEPLELATLPEGDRAETLAFQREVSALSRAIRGALGAVDEARTRLASLRAAALAATDADLAVLGRIEALLDRTRAIRVALAGEPVFGEREIPQLPSISGRVGRILADQSGTLRPPTGTHRESYRHAAEAFGPVLEDLRDLVETAIPAIERELEAVGAPWTPGRVPTWK